MADAWSSLGLPEALVAGIVESGVDGPPTKVQEQAIGAPRDSSLYIVSPTGTGKTLAAVVPVIADMMTGGATVCAIMSPTNSLRTQISEVAKRLAGASIDVVNVGDASETTVRAVIGESERSRIVVCTVSKWLALVNSANSSGSDFARTRVSNIIVDEVDEMVNNPGFRKDLERAIAESPQARVVGMTATHDERAREFLGSVRRVLDIRALDDHPNPDHVHEAVVVASKEILPALAGLLRDELKAGRKAMAFFSSNAFAEFAHDWLTACDDLKEVGLITKHNARTRAGAQTQAHFDTCERCLLISTDVSARGMDFKNVDTVVQVGASEASKYVQRVGRSGRAGKPGRGVLLVSDGPEAFAMDKTLSSISFVSRSVEPATCALKESAQTKKKARRAFRTQLGSYKAVSKIIGLTDDDARSHLIGVFQGVGYPQDAPGTDADAHGGAGGRVRSRDAERRVGLVVCASVTLGLCAVSSMV